MMSGKLRIIDAHGRLFGRINIVDVLAIALKAPKLPEPPLPPTMSIGVVGAFTNLDQKAVANLSKWKTELPPFLGRLLSMSPPEREIERLQGPGKVVIASGGSDDKFRVRAFFDVPCAVV